MKFPLTSFFVYYFFLTTISSLEYESFERITFGSAVKLKHIPSNRYLHSHNIKWGSGSGQQSVTGFSSNDDVNSLWQIKSVNSSILSHSFSSPIECNTVIKLLHINTRNYLHSHLHKAPLSKYQEVSCFGDNTGTISDTGDHWKVICNDNQLFWLNDELILLQHVDTECFLTTNKKNDFNQNNCRNCPIIGQTEVSCSYSGHDKHDWMVSQGIFF